MDWKQSRVLVTGGAGLVGSHLVDRLVEMGCSVTILDNLNPQTHPFGEPDWINKKARFIKGDVRSATDVANALDGVNFIFHQAAFGGFTPQLTEYMDSNATGTAMIFEVIARKKLPVKKIVVASSQAVYGEGAYYSDQLGEVYPEQLRPINQLAEKSWEVSCPKTGKPMKPIGVKETKPLFAETIYGVSKLAQEKLTIGLGRKYNIPSVALRYAVTYGPRQSIYNPYTGLVSIFSTQMLNQVGPTIYEDGLQSRDFLYVSDNVAANLLVMENERSNYQVFNVGRGVSVTVKNIFETLGKLYESNVEPNLPGEFRPMDVRHFVHDATKIESLGFKAQYSLEQGLKEYVDWIKTQGKIADYFSKAKEVMNNSGIVFASK